MSATKTSMRPDILTYSGHYFSFDFPERSTIEPKDIAYALANTCRFSGHCRPYYSVAEHCVRASRIVPEVHAFAALMHDAAEAYVGDVPSPLKQLLPEYKVIEKRVEAAICARFHLPMTLHPSIKHADLVMLATEQRDLMPPHDDEWAIIKDIPPLPEAISPWSRDKAERAWLERFDELAWFS